MSPEQTAPLGEPYPRPYAVPSLYAPKSPREDLVLQIQLLQITLNQVMDTIAELTGEPCNQIYAGIDQVRNHVRRPVHCEEDESGAVVAIRSAGGS